LSGEHDRDRRRSPKASTPDALIRPAPLPGFQERSGTASDQSASRVGAFALAGLAVAAVLVFGVLPRWTSRPVVAVEPQPAPALPAAPPLAPATPGAAAQRAADPVPAPSAPPRPRAASRPDPPDPAPGRPSFAADDAFAATVSEGLAALDRGAWAEARGAFERARNARPDASVVADGLARAEAGLRADSLAEHRKRAEAAEAREDWRAALREYEAALGIDPAVSFGQAGRSRSSQRAELDERLEAYLARPGRLSAEAVAHEAQTALERAAELDPAGPRLTRQIAALQQRLREARTRVAVRLLSDGKTAVSVLRVGPLGSFEETSLDLRPGSYVVVGTRRGYRDVRRTLVVAPGRSPEPLRVSCDEAL
jgi:hypothetical protein